MFWAFTCYLLLYLHLPFTCDIAFGTHAPEVLQLGQTSVPHLKLLNACLEVISELAELFHSPHVLHKDLFLLGVHTSVFLSKCMT